MAAILLTLFAVRTAGQAWLIFTVSLAYGISYVLRDAGESALLPAALAPAQLADVNGWRSSAQEGMKLVAPLGGAGLYAWQGGPAVAVVSATTLVLAAALYAALHLTRTPSRPARQPGGSLRTGLAGLREHTVLVTTALAGISIATSGFATAATYSTVTTVLGLPVTFLGVLGTAQGAGSIIGGLIVGRLITWRGAIAVATTGTVLFAAAILARCLPWWPVTLATGVVAGIGLPWTLTAAVTAMQTRTPAAQLGRVAATANTIMFGPITLAIPLGATAVHLGSRPPLIAGAATCIAAAVVATDRTIRRAAAPPRLAEAHTRSTVGPETPAAENPVA
jgi:hypothetical protein